MNPYFIKMVNYFDSSAWEQNLWLMMHFLICIRKWHEVTCCKQSTKLVRCKALVYINMKINISLLWIWLALRQWLHRQLA